MRHAPRVVTVTLNPAIDQTVTIPGFAAGSVNRVLSSRLDAGGKGVNVAAYLADFGLSATAAGFLGADNDAIFRQMFERKGITDRCVRIPGQTRTGIKIIDPAQRQTTDINFPGQAPGPADIARLFEILRELAADHEWFVLSGSIPAGAPAGIYADIVRLLTGKKVAVDTSGEGLRRALGAGPWLIKPNRDELRELVREQLETPAQILQAGRALAQRHAIPNVVISLGSAGAIFFDGEHALLAEPAPVSVQSTVGAGDAMVAGFIAGKIGALPLAECARLATAFAMIAVGQIGSGLPSVEAVRAAQAQVTLRPLAPDPAGVK